jgi:hypothetical protein
LYPPRLIKGIFETQSADPFPEGDLPIGGKPDEVKHLVADVEPMTTGDDMLDSIRDFMAASPAQRCSPSETSAAGKAAGSLVLSHGFGRCCSSPVVALHRLNGECVLVCVQVLRKAGIDVPVKVGFVEYDPDGR